MGLKDNLEFIDLYSFDPSTAIEFGIPTDQCKGMILLFPLPSDDAISIKSCPSMAHEEAVFIKQTIENSCCLMALLHLLLNNPNDLLDLNKTPETIISLLNLEKSSSSLPHKIIEESDELKKIHEEFAQIGGSPVPEISDKVPFHFVSISPNANEKSSIYLMDGRLSGPIKFDIKNDDGDFFEAACKIAKEEFVEKSKDQTNFAAIILI